MLSRAGLEFGRPDLGRLSALLRQIPGKYGNVYLYVDGIDETVRFGRKRHPALGVRVLTRGPVVLHLLADGREITGKPPAWFLAPC